MSTLNVTVDTSGAILEVMIDDKIIEKVTKVTQSYSKGKLNTTIETTFDTINTIEASAVVAPVLAATFGAGSVAGTTEVLVDTIGSNNHLAYKKSSTVIDTPLTNTVITGALNYASGGDIAGVSVGTYVGVYELTSANAVVKFVSKQLEEADIA